eukprot:539441-Rhodomonas_salina.1
MDDSRCCRSFTALICLQLALTCVQRPAELSCADRGRWLYSTSRSSQVQGVRCSVLTKRRVLPGAFRTRVSNPPHSRACSA